MCAWSRQNQFDYNLQYLGEQDLVPDDIRFSPDSIGSKFQNGEPLERLVADLRSGRVNHRTDSRLKIKVMEWPGRGPISMDNRRLHCLKQYQIHHMHTAVVVRAQVWRLPGMFIDLVERNKIMMDFLLKFDGLH